MKHKTNIIIFALMLLSISASAQIQFTAGLNYESGVPSGAPSSTGSRIRVNLATGRAYIWNQAGSNWRVLAQGIDIVAGCSAPLYTPGYGQSLFAVNGCASPELYYYTGTAWVQISGAGGATYYAGEGIDITNDTISVDTVQRLSFRTDQTYSDGLGTLSWDDTNGTLQLGLKGGNVSLQLGQESVQLVKHADNTGLTKGKVVYLTGSSGSNLTVRYARANNESTSANTFGVMTDDATGGNKAFCTTFGLVHNINTSNLTEGGMVWLSKDTAGAMTAVRPTAPNNGVEVGFCVTKHATNGVIFVTVQNGYELDELHNVYVPSPTNGQVLTYNTTNTRWEAATVADQSATNELQTIDTFSLSGQTLSASLSNDAQAAKTVTLPIIDVVAGTNVTVTKSNGVATVSATGGGGGTPAGSTGEIQYNNAGAFGASSNLAWDNSNVRLNVGAPSAPTGKLNVKGGSTTSSTVNLRLTDSGNTELLKVLDNGNTNIGTGFNWNNTNSRLGIGTSSPSSPLTVIGNGDVFRLDGSAVGSRVTIVIAANAGSYSQISATSGTAFYLSAGTSTDINISPGANDYHIFNKSGNVGIGTLSPSGRMNIRGSNLSSGTNALLVQNSTPSDIYKIENDGKISYWATNTAAGTTGAQTINRPSGTVNFGIGASSLVVTNSLCTTASLVFAEVRTNDSTAYIKNVVPGSGSFTINLGAAATAETSVGFFIIN